MGFKITLSKNLSVVYTLISINNITRKNSRSEYNWLSRFASKTFGPDIQQHTQMVAESAQDVMI